MGEGYTLEPEFTDHPGYPRIKLGQQVTVVVFLISVPLFQITKKEYCHLGSSFILGQTTILKIQNNLGQFIHFSASRY